MATRKNPNPGREALTGRLNKDPKDMKKEEIEQLLDEALPGKLQEVDVAIEWVSTDLALIVSQAVLERFQSGKMNMSEMTKTISRLDQLPDMLQALRSLLSIMMERDQ